MATTRRTSSVLQWSEVHEGRSGVGDRARAAQEEHHRPGLGIGPVPLDHAQPRTRGRRRLPVDQHRVPGLGDLLGQHGGDRRRARTDGTAHDHRRRRSGDGPLPRRPQDGQLVVAPHHVHGAAAQRVREPDPRPGEVESGILGQDLRVQLAEACSRVDTELLGEHRARPVVRLERGTLATGAIAGEHQELPEPFSQRVVGDLAQDLGDRGPLLAQREHRLQPGLLRQEPQLTEPADLGRAEDGVLATGVGGPAPEGQRVAARVERRLRPAAGRCLASEVRELDEPARVRVPIGGDQPVAGPGRHQHARLSTALRLERVAQPQDVGLQ